MTKAKIKKMISRNPSVDADAVYEVLKALRQLRQSGLARRQYNLDIPFAKRINASSEDRRKK